MLFRSYQFSLSLALVSYAGMCLGGWIMGNLTVMGVFYLLAQIGTASMFVSQTVFLADIVDYGEVKTGRRAESVTFSMKGFLQKMAYTLQTIILYASLALTRYDGSLHSANPKGTHTAVSAMMFVVPFVLMAASLIVYSTKFRLHGKTMEDITAQIEARRNSAAD